MRCNGGADLREVLLAVRSAVEIDEVAADLSGKRALPSATAQASAAAAHATAPAACPAPTTSADAASAVALATADVLVIGQTVADVVKSGQIRPAGGTGPALGTQFFSAVHGNIPYLMDASDSLLHQLGPYRIENC